jgi:RNA polymerase sigma-70 factor, ECF subfamily
LARANLSKVMIPEQEISAIVARSQGGDDEAFHCLFVRYQKPVLNFIYDMLSDRARAEELAQETFVRAYKNMANLRDREKFSSWLFSIAKNIVREAIREKYHEGGRIGLDSEASLQIKDGRSRPDEELIHSELNSAMRRALQELNEDWRTVFVLKIFNQCSYEEIVEITGWSLGKVKTDLHRARLEMKRKLQDYLD